MATDEIKFTVNGTAFDIILTVPGSTGTGTATAVTGTVGGAAITGLNGSFGGPDNEITSTSYGYVDMGGISFDTAGDEFNFYYYDGYDVIVDNNENFQNILNSSGITFSYTTCYYPGTFVRTPVGDIAVDALRIGDEVVTADGRVLPVRWIGRNTVSTRLRDPLTVLPIRIKAGALADNVPERDLLVSPEHAMFIDGLLIQAHVLVNGVSIVRERDVPETFSYHHVELAEHALLLAEGAPAESFVDNVHRRAFDNWEEHQALYGDEPSIAEMPYPRVQSYRQLPVEIRQWMSARARALSAATWESSVAA